MTAPRLAAATVLAMLAWGGPATSAPDATPTVHVGIHYSSFEPSAFAFAPGDTVTFVVENVDPIDHEFIIGDRGVQLAHERGTESYHPPRPGEMTIPAGETRTTTYTFDDPGRLIFGCHLPGHYAYGMRGTIAVA